MRYALYFTPSQDHPLTRAAAQWLGRDAFAGPVARPDRLHGIGVEELAFHTASARRYGFHGTLKAPFELAEGKTEASLVAALDAFCEEVEPCMIARLSARQLDGFFALVPEERVAALDRLAGDVVVAFDRFRAPMSEGGIARRNPDSLTPGQLKNLHRWGYPYVFDDFRFHMTLTGRAIGAEAERLRSAIDRHFAGFVGHPLEIASIALFVEPEPGAPFSVRAFRRFGRARERRTA